MILKIIIFFILIIFIILNKLNNEKMISQIKLINIEFKMDLSKKIN